MSAVLGLIMGAGVLLIWISFWEEPQRPARRADGWYERTQDALVRAGAPSVTPWALAGTAAVLGLVVAVLAAGAAGSPAIGLAFGIIGGRAPFALVTSRAARRHATMREAWPDAVDHLASGIRAGLSLPEALGQLGDRGPEQLREAFTSFAEDFRATGRFGDSTVPLPIGMLRTRRSPWARGFRTPARALHRPTGVRAVPGARAPTMGPLPPSPRSRGSSLRVAGGGGEAPGSCDPCPSSLR